MARSLLDFFPVPKFLAMETAGLALSDDRVQFVTFSKKHGKLELGEYGEKRLPQGAIDRGDIKKADVLIAALEAIRSEHKLSLVEASLPEERSFLYTASVPKVKPDELRDSVAFTLADNVPLKASEVVYDYVVVDEKENSLEVAVSAFPEKVVVAYTDILHAAGLVPVSFEVESQAVAKSVVPQEEGEPCMVVNMFGSKVGFYIISKLAVRFSSTVRVDDAAKGQANQYNILREAKKILSYWETHDSPVKKIFVCGRDIEDDSLGDYLANGLGVSVEVANVWRNAFSFDELIPDLSKTDALRYAAAIGLALPE